MKQKIIHLFVAFSLVLVFFILKKTISGKCKKINTADQVELNFPFYETRNPEIYEYINKLLEEKKNVTPGGGYFGSHSRWAKLRVNSLNENEPIYELDLYFSYLKDGDVALNACNIIVVRREGNTSLCSNKGWYFSDDIVNSICNKIASEFTFTFPDFRGEVHPAPYTLSYQSIVDSGRLKNLTSLFNGNSMNIRTKSTFREIARIEVKDHTPKSMSDLLKLSNSSMYNVTLYDVPGYFEISVCNNTDIEFTQKKVDKLCHDCSIYNDFIQLVVSRRGEE